MGKEPSEPRPGRSIAPEILTGLVVAVGLAAADTLAMVGLGGSSFDEFFFRPFWHWNLSPAGYVLVLLLAAGTAAGLLIGLAERFVIRSTGPWRVLISGLLVLGSQAFLLFKARSSSFDDLGDLGRYLTVLGTVTASLAVLFLLAPALSRSGEGGRPLRRVELGVLAAAFVLALAILSGPLGQHLLLPDHPVGARAARRPNVLILLLDTLRADALSCLGPAPARTPHIDRLAAEGILFRRAISPAPWTVPSHGSLFTGLYPSQHGAVWEHPLLDEELRVLANAMYQAGYRTVGFSENPHISSSSGFGRGFEEFSDLLLSSRRAMLPPLADSILERDFDRPPTYEFTKESVSHLERWIRRNALEADAPPFFAFLNLMAAHLPAYARPDYDAETPPADVVRRLAPINLMPQRYNLPAFRLKPGDLDVLRMLYLGDVRYLDARLGSLFDFLRAKGLLDDTVVIVVADHGENFGEHGLIEHAFCLYNTLLNVPLIIRYPAKVPAGTVRDDFVSTIRLFDTVLDLAGIRDRPALPDAARRPSLLDASPEREIFAECENLVYLIKNALTGQRSAEGFDYKPFDKSLKCLYADGRKLIRSSTGQVELYDTTNDWAETRNLAAVEPARVKALLERLGAWEKALVPPRPVPRRASLSRSAKEALKALGYVH